MDTARAPRNHVIDLARASSIVMVVVFHGLLYKIGFEGGHPTMTPWAPPHFPWWLISWFLMCIPVFFVAGGFAHALIVDRTRRQHTGFGHYLANRGRRLVGPLLSFVTVWAVVASIAAWTGWFEPAVTLSRQFMQLLWFLAVYLVIVGIAPAMVSAHDRWGWRVPVVLAALAALVDAWSFSVDDYEIRNLNMLLVWPLVHQLGIAYERGWFRRGPGWTPWAALVAGVGGVATLVFAFGYPGSSIGLADIPIANVQPPTLAMAFLALAQCGVLGLVERSGVLTTVSPRFEKALATINALMMSVYLWHIPCIILAAAVGLIVGILVPPLAPLLLSQLMISAMTLALCALIVPLIAQVDLRLIPPLGAHQKLGRAVVAYLILTSGATLTWLNGTVLHPRSPWSTAGVLLIWLGSWLMAKAADGRAESVV